MPLLQLASSARKSLPWTTALAALAFAPFADGAVVLSNHAPIIAGVSRPISLGAGSGEAVKVTTGASSGWSVNSVSILAGNVSASWAFQIWTDSSGTLGTLVGTSGTLTNSLANGSHTFTFASPVSLSANTSYWFTPAIANPATAAASSISWKYSLSPGVAPSQSAAGWLQGSQLSTTDYTTWSSNAGRSYASLEIDATAIAAGVPDGTHTALLLLPGAGLLAVRLRRRPRRSATGMDCIR